MGLLNIENSNFWVKMRLLISKMVIFVDQRAIFDQNLILIEMG